MNQNTPNPRLLGGSILALYPLNGVVEAVPWKPTFNYGWYWTPRSDCRQGWRWERLPFAEGIMLNFWGERRTKTQEGTETKQQTPGIIRAGETRGNKLTCLPHYVNSPWSSVALGDSPCLGGWPLIKINSLHNNIWFDSLLLNIWINTLNRN